MKEKISCTRHNLAAPHQCMNSRGELDSVV